VEALQRAEQTNGNVRSQTRTRLRRVAPQIQTRVQRVQRVQQMTLQMMTLQMMTLQTTLQTRVQPAVPPRLDGTLQIVVLRPPMMAEERAKHRHGSKDANRSASS